MNEKTNLWRVMAILLVVSSAFGFAAFLVGRKAYGEYLGKKSNSED